MHSTQNKKNMRTITILLAFAFASTACLLHGQKIGHVNLDSLISLMPEFKNFLNKAIEHGRTDVEICINTNATNINKEYIALLSQFKNWNIVVSIDGYDTYNKYIRWPSDWSTIVSNVKNLLELTPNVAFNIAVSIWNITNLSKLMFFLDNEFPNCTVLLNEVSYPDYNRFSSFPDKQVALADLDKIKDSHRYKTNAAFKKRIDYIYNQVKNSVVNIKTLEAFFNYNDALDQSRNIELKDYIPELEKCRNLIKNPT